jgi:diguanylate cyclase (GGDEF)-like protein
VFKNEKIVQQSIQKDNKLFQVETQSKSASIINHPIRLTFCLMVTIFFAETIVMFILMFLPPLTGYKEALLDACLLTIIIIPILYYFVYKPFRLHLAIRKKQEEKLVTISLTDELTGIYNRRGFFNLAEHQLIIAKRIDQKVFMMYLDIDKLKEINDTFGHDEGDIALIDIANILKESYRESDIIARIGGDEFVVFAIEAAEESSNIITERLHKNLDIHNANNSTIYNLSVSVGITYYDPEHPCSIGDLLNQADKLMYQQKKQKQKISTYYNA